MMVGIDHAAFSVLQEVRHAFQCLVSQFQSRSLGVEQYIRCVCFFAIIFIVLELVSESTGNIRIPFGVDNVLLGSMFSR